MGAAAVHRNFLPAQPPTSRNFLAGVRGTTPRAPGFWVISRPDYLSLICDLLPSLRDSLA